MSVGVACREGFLERLGRAQRKEMEPAKNDWSQLEDYSRPACAKPDYLCLHIFKNVEKVSRLANLPSVVFHLHQRDQVVLSMPTKLLVIPSVR